ncbi:DUF5017 domain-containing protein [Aestuariibaculum suncheonense]|uniref:DUF5017 domain-containing protein n=1 Tax=Aestuariibaculum suncheonense TaxID=1028745 RepID=A0A8J6UB90_9FLAO|nr:DUF5017 domain-containing protein [Aestuariibaculum suncheonense]MBD0835680.1 DUF5017 domain-containing protein [Aestuariibaculum suncheonense]
MKNFNKIVACLFVVACLVQSCDNAEEVSSPNFTVTPNSLEVKAGDPVIFTVDNAPDFLRFYSGEFGHQYKYRDRTNAEGTVTMSFENSQKWGLGSNATGTLTVWYSKDYDGSGDPESVKSATWLDITDRFDISTRYDFTFQSSGIVDVTDLADGNTIYFGFRYFSDNIIDRGAEWYFNDLSIQMDVEDAPALLTVADETNPGFTPVDIQGVVEAWNAAKWYWDSGNGYWRMRGNSDRIVNEDWLITNAINLTAVAPDTAVNLKAYSTLLNDFEYTYTTPGVYTVTLVGNNTTIYGDKEKVEQFSITVTE